jgi:uncharacterized protein (TIGR02996 family)
MSATIRVDIGRSLAELLEAVQPGIGNEIGAEAASRWAGWRAAAVGHRNSCVTFGLKLPSEAGKVWRLLLLVSRLQRLSSVYARDVTHAENTPTARNGCRTLAAKLTVALGLPGCVAEGEERAFLVSIDENPDDRTAWTAYADWLQERDDANAVWRGKVIAGWLGKKSMHYKYGMPDVKWSDPDYKIQTDYKHLPVRDLLGESLVPDLFAEL